MEILVSGEWKVTGTGSNICSLAYVELHFQVGTIWEGGKCTEIYVMYFKVIAQHCFTKSGTVWLNITRVQSQSWLNDKLANIYSCRAQYYEDKHAKLISATISENIIP